MNRRSAILFVLFLMLPLLAILNVVHGAIDIPLSRICEIVYRGVDESPESYIIWHSRIPQIMVALLAGSALAVGGLMLQVLFNNPLTDSSILGINAGASLGSALVIILFAGGLTISSTGIHIGIVLGSWVGGLLIGALLLVFASTMHNLTLLLIVGIMLSYVASSIITLLSFLSNATQLQTMVFWSMGSFNQVSASALPLFSGIIILGLLASIFAIKYLNVLPFGSNYAQSLGVSLKKTRFYILLTTIILTSTVSAYCGPIAFIGLSVPHICRFLLATANHRWLLPASILAGGCLSLICLFLMTCMPDGKVFPVNVITPFFGVPVILYVLFANFRKK